ncbi:MAG: MbnP family protein [Bacteroidia bacterium]|nr:MbnP family protein [Bacteroidia bacterium]
MRFCLWIVFLMFSNFVFAQSAPGNIRFNLTFGSQPVEIGKNYYSPATGDSIKLEVVKFYISHLQFFRDNIPLAVLKKQHMLVDAGNPETLHFPIPEEAAGKFNRVVFNLGTDSLTNVSGAFGGDLDPTKGMYWAWQSGYINLKLEGVSKACPARNHYFQFHIGGYQSPFPSCQIIDLPAIAKNDLTIEVALDSFFSQVNIAETYQIMSPGQQAVSFARLFASLFSLAK